MLNRMLKKWAIIWNIGSPLKKVTELGSLLEKVAGWGSLLEKLAGNVITAWKGSWGGTTVWKGSGIWTTALPGSRVRTTAQKESGTEITAQVGSGVGVTVQKVIGICTIEEHVTVLVESEMTSKNTICVWLVFGRADLGRVFWGNENLAQTSSSCCIVCAMWVRNIGVELEQEGRTRF